MANLSFNKEMDKYISSKRTQDSKKFDFSGFMTKLKPNKSFKIMPKIKETKIEFVDPDEIVHSAEQKKIKRRKCIFSGIFHRKCKKNIVDEDLNPVSENFKFDVKTEKMDEFDEDLAEIEALESKNTKKSSMLRLLLMKLRIIKDLEDKEEEILKEEIDLIEEQKEDIKDEILTLIDFSVDVLKVLPSKEFEKIKNNASFQSYKRIVQKYMKKN